jgi:hypothetical protein
LIHSLTIGEWPLSLRYSRVYARIRDALHFDEALDELDELILKNLVDELFKSNAKQKIVWPPIMVNARFVEITENTPNSRIEFWDVFAKNYTQGGY